MCAHLCVNSPMTGESPQQSPNISILPHQSDWTLLHNTNKLTQHDSSHATGKEKVFSDDIFFVYCRVLPYKPSKRQDVFLLWLQLKAQPLVKEGEVVYHYNATQCAEIAGVSVHVNVYIFENWRLLSYCLSFVYYFWVFLLFPHLDIYIWVCMWMCVTIEFVCILVSHSYAQECGE